MNKDMEVACPKCGSTKFAVFGKGTVQELIETLLDSKKNQFSIPCQCVKCGQKFSLIFHLTEIRRDLP